MPPTVKRPTSPKNLTERPPLPAGDGTADSPRLLPIQREMIDLFGGIAEHLGLSLAAGQVFGLIYASRRPLPQQVVGELLKAGKHSLRVGISELLEIRAIRIVRVPGDKRDHFLPEADLHRLTANLLHTRFQRSLERDAYRLEELLKRTESLSGADAAFFSNRVASLHTWHTSALRAIPVLRRIVRPEPRAV